MQIKKPGIPAAKRHILAHLLLGILLITGITFTAARADLVDVYKRQAQRHCLPQTWQRS